MNVLVLLAGIADPKWPLGFAPGGAADAGAVGGGPARVLSPFDEAALELALKLRDDQPETRITAGVLDSREADPLLRTAAGLRPDEVFGIAADTLEQWDARVLSLQLRSVVLGRSTAFELVLVGREMGDRDDGTLPACLAERLGWRFAALAQQIEAAGDSVRVTRERGSVEESIALDTPLVVSVTNDRRNRLRHPLIKNVMAARRSVFPVVRAPPADETASLSLQAVAALAPAVRSSSCRFLEGAPAVQAVELARYLQHWRDAR